MEEFKELAESLSEWSKERKAAEEVSRARMSKEEALAEFKALGERWAAGVSSVAHPSISVQETARLWESVGEDWLGAHLLAEMGARISSAGRAKNDPLAIKIGEAMAEEGKRFYSRSNGRGEPEELLWVKGMQTQDPEAHIVEDVDVSQRTGKEGSHRVQTLCGRKASFIDDAGLVRMSHALKFATMCLKCADEELKRSAK